MLTGNKQVYPLWIYKVSDVGMVAEVTSTTACHSVENDIMKVCINIHIHVLTLNHDTPRQHAHSRTVVTSTCASHRILLVHIHFYKHQRACNTMRITCAHCSVCNQLLSTSARLLKMMHK